jgi:hypothetical protein
VVFVEDSEEKMVQAVVSGIVVQIDSRLVGIIKNELAFSSWTDGTAFGMFMAKS